MSIRSNGSHMHPRKGPHIGEFFNQFGRWLSCTVTRPSFNPDQYRLIAGLGMLECRSKLEAVRRENPVVMVTRQHHGWRVSSPFLDIVIGRVRPDGFKIFRGRPVNRSPRPRPSQW